MKYTLLLVLGMSIFTSGCGHQSAITPKDKDLVGLWIPDPQRSTLPVGSQPIDTKLWLNSDHTFVATGFPSYASFGNQHTVNGRWEVRREGNKWRLALPWSTESQDILDSTDILIKGGAIFLEFWIGDPDLYQRLVLRRIGAQ